VDRHKDAFRRVIKKAGRFPFFRELSEDDLEAVAGRVFWKRHEKGHTFFHQQEASDRMYIIDRGDVALIDPELQSRKPVRVGKGDAFGGLSFLTGSRHTVTAVAESDTSVWVLRRRDFEELLRRSPSLEKAVKRFLGEERITEYLSRKQHFDPERAAEWVHMAVKSMDTRKYIPSASQMTEHFSQKRGAPMAIWLGILLDGIPESLVIGASLIHAHLSLSLIGGLFLSNYPEALSSSTGMRQQGFSVRRVLSMWITLMILTGVGAVLGNLFFEGAPPVFFSLVQGLAAGSMLTMIAETMLPEAYYKGGSIIGLATLFGFLAAIFFKTLE
jgi:CRP-like cAMP-binding protein